MKVMFLLDDWVIDPLGIGYLSTALKVAQHDVSIVKTKHDDYQARIDHIQPDIIAFSITTGYHKRYFQISRQLKKRWPHMVHVAGGPHATFFPEMAREPSIDATIQGEAEETLVEFVNSVEKFGLDNVVRSDRYCVPPSKLVQNLDEIPWPDRALLYSYPENRSNPVKNVMMTRGCQFACTYCFNGIYKKMFPSQKTFRQRSVEDVISEIKYLKIDFPETKFIFFQDDEFVRDVESLAEFAEQYKSVVALPFHCQLRADVMTTNKVRILKDMGCVSVTFAAECGNDGIRKDLLKRNMSKEQISNCRIMLRNAGIACRIENMIGLPGESFDEALETLDMNIELNPEAAFCSLYQPYPKTPLGDLAKDMHVWDGDVDTITPSFFDRSPIKRDTARWFDNLQKWFGLCVEYPILRPFIKLLVRFPRMKLMSWVSTKFRRYCYDVRLYRIS